MLNTCTFQATNSQRTWLRWVGSERSRSDLPCEHSCTCGLDMCWPERLKNKVVPCFLYADDS